MHMIAHGGRDDSLFVGAILESVFFPAQPHVPELEYQYDRVVRQTGCAGVSRAKQLTCLRAQDVATLQRTNIAQPFPGREKTPAPLPLFYWTPCIDGELLRDQLYSMFKKGEFVDVPILAGTDTDGMSRSCQPFIAR